MLHSTKQFKTKLCGLLLPLNLCLHIHQLSLSLYTWEQLLVVFCWSYIRKYPWLKADMTVLSTQALVINPITTRVFTFFILQ